MTSAHQSASLDHQATPKQSTLSHKNDTAPPSNPDEAKAHMTDLSTYKAHINSKPLTKVQRMIADLELKTKGKDMKLEVLKWDGKIMRVPSNTVSEPQPSTMYY